MELDQYALPILEHLRQGGEFLRFRLFNQENIYMMDGRLYHGIDEVTQERTEFEISTLNAFDFVCDTSLVYWNSPSSESPHSIKMHKVIRELPDDAYMNVLSGEAECIKALQELEHEMRQKRRDIVAQRNKIYVETLSTIPPF